MVLESYNNKNDYPVPDLRARDQNCLLTQNVVANRDGCVCRRAVLALGGIFGSTLRVVCRRVPRLNGRSNGGAGGAWDRSFATVTLLLFSSGCRARIL